ncbi:MAG: hypothetical protein KatS3mg115_0674 [Candidatus Poribacteria bacterium]|nr:MAG: hypothetical protein KatS3mg115_0674 [Candidatus Poribacteria bacterium]
MTTKTIAIVGTLDTKGAEFRYLKEQIEQRGHRTLVINAGVQGEPFFEPDVSAAEVARAGGVPLEQLRERADRGESVATMAKGAATIAARLYAEGRIHGIVSLGGSAGTTIGTSAMRALPVGVPKLMVSTLTSGNVGPYVQTKDIAMMYSVVDIAGLNQISRRILANAAGAIVGMVETEVPSSVEDRPLIGATMFGVTTPCVTRAREVLEQAGYEVLVFHATGTGGRAMEDLIRAGFFCGVLDVTTTEWADELVDGVLSAGPERLDAAAEMGIPQVVAPGALDMVNFGPPETVPEKFRGRRFYQHNPNVTLMRTTPEENRKLGEIIARKLSAAKGPVVFFFPKKGVSAIDREGQPFYWPEADAAFLEGFKAHVAPHVRVVEMDAHINDPEFAEAMAQTLLSLLRSQEKEGKAS